MAISILGRTKTRIQVIEIDTTPSEDHQWKSEATMHPVENGADISDHVHRKPRSISIEGIISAVTSKGLDTDRIALARDTLEQYRNTDTLVTIVTGFAVYERMLILDLSFKRSAELGRSLGISFSATEIRTVATLRVAAVKRPKAQQDTGFFATHDATGAQRDSVLFNVSKWAGGG